MSRDKSGEDAIEEALRRIEFPGEDEVWVRAYLDERGFVDKVMRSIARTRIRLSRSTLWGFIGILNVAVLAVAWTNPFLVEDVLALRNELFTFFFSFLGLTLAGCIVGFLFTAHTGKMEGFFHNLAREFPLDRLRNLFRHPRG